MKQLTLLLLCLFLLPLFCACTQRIDLTKEGGAEEILAISENPEPYLGQEILIAGYYTYQDFIDRYHYVLLSLEEGKNVGFEIRWQGDFPSVGTPIKVRGILKSVTEFGQRFIYLDVIELSPLEEAK